MCGNVSKIPCIIYDLLLFIIYSFDRVISQDVVIDEICLPGCIVGVSSLCKRLTGNIFGDAQGLEKLVQGREFHPALIIDETGIHEHVRNGL